MAPISRGIVRAHRTEIAWRANQGQAVSAWTADSATTFGYTHTACDMESQFRRQCNPKCRQHMCGVKRKR